MENQQHPVLLFDGVCNLCNGFVQFVIKRDTAAVFRFTALQSEAGKALLSKHLHAPTDLSTVILIENGKLYTHSDVALQVVRHLGGIWSVFYVFVLIPRPLRDQIYNWIAKNRYRWFGKKEQCMLPTPEIKARFLE